MLIQYAHMLTFFLIVVKRILHNKIFINVNEFVHKRLLSQNYLSQKMCLISFKKKGIVRKKKSYCSCLCIKMNYQQSDKTLTMKEIHAKPLIRRYR